LKNYHNNPSLANPNVNSNAGSLNRQSIKRTPSNENNSFVQKNSTSGDSSQPQ